MKKLLIILFSLTLVLCGCAKNTQQKTVNGITFTAEISLKDKEFTLNGAVDKSGIFTGTVIKPETIKGLQIYADDSVASVEFMGLKYENELKNYPVSSIANLIISSLGEDNTDNAGPKTGNIKGYDYELTFSEDGLPQNLSVPLLNLNIEFKNVQKTAND